MKPTEKLVRAAVANPHLKEVRQDFNAKAKFFDVYRVELPLPEFSGVPTEWTFAVHNRNRSQEKKAARPAILTDAYEFIDSVPRSELVVLVSNDTPARLGDEFDA